MRYNLLFDKAVKEGKITYFDEEIYDRMSDTIIACLPVSLYIKYSKYLFSKGTCYERSLYMFLALNDALLVRGNNMDLEYNYGKGHGGHGWVEIDNFVYDPSLMLRFDKDTYYRLYGCSNVKKMDRDTYFAQNGDYVDKYVSYSLEDFKPNGKRRLELGVLIFQLKSLSRMVRDKQFADDLDNYLSLVEYDEEQIRDERDRFIKKNLFKDEAISIISGNKR